MVQAHPQQSKEVGQLTKHSTALICTNNCNFSHQIAGTTDNATDITDGRCVPSVGGHVTATPLPESAHGGLGFDADSKDEDVIIFTLTLLSIQ